MPYYRSNRRPHLSRRGKLFLLYVTATLIGTFLLAGWLAESHTLRDLEQSLTAEALQDSKLLAQSFSHEVVDLVNHHGGLDAAREALQETVERTMGANETSVCVLDNSGRVVAHPRRDFYRKQTDLGWMTLEPVGSGPARSLRDLGQAGEEGQGLYLSKGGPQAFQVVTSVPLPTLGLQVLAMQPKSRIEGRVQEMRVEMNRVRYLIVGVIFFLVVPAVTLLTWRFELRMERKVKVLEWVTRQLEDRTRELEERNREIEKLAAIREEYFGVLAHDFRSPLTSIRMAAELLLRDTVGPMPEKAKSLSQMILDNGVQLTELADDVLDLSKLETEGADLEREDTDLVKLAKESVRNHIFLAESKGVRVEWVGPEVLPHAHLDQGKLRQVLNNLVTNAIKFTGKGGRVELKAEALNENLHLTVTDNGVGIPPEALRRIFDKYEQVRQRKETGVKEGSGLGLAIAKRIVELHGGKIWAESEGPDQGSTFHVVLPAA